MQSIGAILARAPPAHEQVWLSGCPLLAGLSRRVELLQHIGEVVMERRLKPHIKTTVRVAQVAFSDKGWRLRFPTQTFETPLYVAHFPTGVYCFQGSPRIDFTYDVTKQDDRQTVVSGSTLDECLNQAYQDLGPCVAELSFQDSLRWTSLGLEAPPFDAWTEEHTTMNDRAFANSRFFTWASESRSLLFTEVAQAAYREHTSSSSSARRKVFYGTRDLSYDVESTTGDDSSSSLASEARSIIGHPTGAEVTRSIGTCGPTGGSIGDAGSSIGDVPSPHGADPIGDSDPWAASLPTVKCSRIRWRPKLKQWGLWWTNCIPARRQELLLVGYLPEELRIWRWDVKLRSIDDKRRLGCRLNDTPDYFVARPPGELIASFPL